MLGRYNSLTGMPISKSKDLIDIKLKEVSLCEKPSGKSSRFIFFKCEDMELNSFTGQYVQKNAEPVLWPSLSGQVAIAKQTEKKWPSISGSDSEEEDDDDDDDDDDNSFEKDITIFEKDNDEHIICGTVYSPDEVDSQGDKASEKEIRKAAYSFLESEQVFKINHSSKTAAKILESYIAPADFTINKQAIKKGSWILTLRIISKSVWAKIKSGELTGFSMAGTATRV